MIAKEIPGTGGWAGLPRCWGLGRRAARKFLTPRSSNGRALCIGSFGRASRLLSRSDSERSPVRRDVWDNYVSSGRKADFFFTVSLCPPRARAADRRPSSRTGPTPGL